MPRLSSAHLLNLWERGRNRHPVDRALLALGAAFPEQSFDELADLPVGRRDAALLELRCETFGPRVEGYTDCPGCGAQLEFEVDGASLAEGMHLPAPEESVIVAGAHFRLPTSRDLARIAGVSDEQAAARQLFDLCRVRGDEDAGVDVRLVEVEACMAEADPAANATFALTCEACGHHWEQVFDIAEFLWEEIEARAKRLLRDVHVLARTYAWPEQDILAMSDARRETYLEMVPA